MTVRNQCSITLLTARRPLFLHGGLQMLACYVTLAALLGIEFRKCAVPPSCNCPVGIPVFSADCSW